MRPAREVATNNRQTYFVTSNTAGRQVFFRHERWARLMVDLLVSYRPERFLLHGFTVMPDHFHALITPAESLEKAVQMIKGGFSFRAKKELAWRGDVWVAGFSDHRLRDEEDFIVHERYVDHNAVKAGLVESAGAYRFCSASGAYALDAFPRGLKPEAVAGPSGGAEAPPFQNGRRENGAEAPPFLSRLIGGGAEAPYFQSARDGGADSAPAFHCDDKEVRT